ncbi:MAG: hypothetical protein WAV40_04460 [Microgenomates group bacterium]
MAKSHERLLARELRREGKSIREIARQLSVSKGSASLWCRDIILSKSQVEKLLEQEHKGNAAGRIKAWEWHREEKRLRFEANHKAGYEEVKVTNKNELFLLGLAIYWSEGSKNDGRVLLTNSDPHMIRLYVRWLTECFGIMSSQITCRVTINESHCDRREEIEQYWSHIVGLPLSQFTKTTMIHSKWTKLYENRNTYYGVLAVHVQKSTDLSYRVMGSIDRLREVGDLHDRIGELAG